MTHFNTHTHKSQTKKNIIFLQGPELRPGNGEDHPGTEENGALKDTFLLVKNFRSIERQGHTGGRGQENHSKGINTLTHLKNRLYSGMISQKRGT